jgi:hypothetical protein
MTHDTTIAHAVLGQVPAGALNLIGGAARAGLRAPPRLALSGFALLIGFLLLSPAGTNEEASVNTLPAHA